MSWTVNNGKLVTASIQGAEYKGAMNTIGGTVMVAVRNAPRLASGDAIILDGAGYTVLKQDVIGASGIHRYSVIAD